MSYGLATVFTLAAWFAGLVIDVNVRVGDLGLRTVLPVIVMGCCVMKYMPPLSKGVCAYKQPTDILFKRLLLSGKAGQDKSRQRS